MTKKPHWYLILTSTRARIVRGLPAAGEPVLPELVLRAPNRKLRDIMAAKPGRSFSSGSAGRRSAIEPGSDPIRQDAVDFVHEVIATLEALRSAGDFHSLTIFAAPDMLGLLRQDVPSRLKPLIAGEFAKNLGSVPESQLPAVLERELEG